MNFDDVMSGFRDPPPGYSQTPFWWWVGDKLDFDRLRWQLDQLVEGGVRSAIISYNHWPDGSTNVGEPEVFGTAWWDVLIQLLDYAAPRGITLGMKDYCLLNPMLRLIGFEHAITGWELRATDEGRSDALDLSTKIDRAKHSRVFGLPTAFDPLHANSGRLVIEKFYSPFAARLGKHFGTTFNIFFQDELDFSCRFPLWSTDIPRQFSDRFGYSLEGRLHEIFEHDAKTSQLRVDFGEMNAVLVEKNYFEPIHNWMEAHNCLFGHDNAGRGSPRVGLDHYGDYMRTMRWYSAPGSDDPDLRGPRAFKGIKVASSIAHLNGRARVWAECFHSSGWGVTPHQMLIGVNTLFVLGANLINLHGLYYTTNRSHWEWAPPDFHFRQPFWSATASLNSYIERMSWLLSQGVHSCDIAILYPTSALAGGLNSDVPPFGPNSLSDDQREVTSNVDSAEALSFEIADHLFGNGVDFDFVDGSAFENARFISGQLRVGDTGYGTLILADATTLDRSTRDTVVSFLAEGGRVVAVGTLEPEVAALPGIIRLIEIGTDVAERISPKALRRIRLDHPDLRVSQRSVHGVDVWCLMNVGSEACAARPHFSGLKTAARLDAFTGHWHNLAVDDGYVPLALQAGELAVISSRSGVGEQPSIADETHIVARFADDAWTYSLVPTLDNRFRDYALDWPDALAELRHVNWRDDRSRPWQTVAPGFAPRLRLLGPIAGDAEPPTWRGATQAGASDDDLAALAQGEMAWRDCLASATEGLFEDPWAKDWRSGPHGLKRARLLDWIDLDGVAGDVWYADGWWRDAPPNAVGLRISSRAAWELWSGGELISARQGALDAAKLPVWGLPDQSGPEATVALKSCLLSGRFFLRLVQGYAGHCRVRMQWIDGDGCELAEQPTCAALLTANPQCYAVPLPPGSVSLTIEHHGAIQIVSDLGQWSTTTVANEGANRTSLVRNVETMSGGSLEFWITDPSGRRGGDCLLSSIAIASIAGTIPLGDWSQHGLSSFSGGVRYRQSTLLNADDLARPLMLRIGNARAAATITINGAEVGSTFAPPWTVPCGSALVEGINVFEITVFNTLANHFADAAPSGYVFAGQTCSGLFGPVELFS